MVILNGVRLVTLQFSFSNPDAIPATVKRLDRETQNERKIRKARSSGIMVIEPVENCSLSGFLKELEEAGYEMVDALYKERIDAKDPRGERTYHMVRFLFACREFVKLSAEFKEVRKAIYSDLQGLCGNAFWRVRAFLNPFYKNDEEVPGQRAVSINFEARRPALTGDRPVTMWQYINGKRVGDAPRPIRADYRLRVIGNTIRTISDTSEG